MSDGDSDEDLEFLRQQALSSLAINQKLYYGKSTLPESEIMKLNVPEFTETVVAEGEFSESDVDEIVEEIVMSSEEEGEESDSDLLSLKSEDSFDKILHSLELEAAKPTPGKKSKEAKKIPEAYKADILDDTWRNDQDRPRRDFSSRGRNRGSREGRDGRGGSRDHRQRPKDRRVSSKSRDYARDERRFADKETRETRDVRESHRESRETRDGREETTSLLRHSTKDKTWDKLPSKSNKQVREIKLERNEESSVKRKRLMELPTDIAVGIRDLRMKSSKYSDRADKRDLSKEPPEETRKNSKSRHNRKTRERPVETEESRKSNSPPLKPKTEFDLLMEKKREERLKRFGIDLDDQVKEPKVIKLSKETRKEGEGKQHEESRRKDGAKNPQVPSRSSRLKSALHIQGRTSRGEETEKKTSQDEDLRDKLVKRRLTTSRLFIHAVDKLNSSSSSSSLASQAHPAPLASEISTPLPSSSSESKPSSSKGKRKVSLMPF